MPWPSWRDEGARLHSLLASWGDHTPEPLLFSASAKLPWTEVTPFCPSWKAPGMEHVWLMVGTKRCLDPGHPVTLQVLGTGIKNMGEVEDMKQE